MRNTIVFITLLTISTGVFAARFETTALIKEIMSAENPSTTSSGNLGAIFIEGFSSAGTCYVATSTLAVLIRLRDNEQGKLQSSIALSAMMSGKKVMVRVDDNNKDQYGACYLEQIRINTGF